MFVCQRVNPGQAKTGCRLKTKVALHGFAKVAHYYKRSLAHTSMTPNMITRCEKRPTSPSAWGLAKKYTPTRSARSKSHSRTAPYTMSCLDISKKYIVKQKYTQCGPTYRTHLIRKYYDPPTGCNHKSPST